MISFDMLTPLIRGIFALWALLLCLTNIGSGVLAAVKKHYRFSVFALVLFIPAYFLWQVIFDFSLFGETDKAVKLTQPLCSLNWIYWFAALLIFTAMAVLLFGLNIKYDKTFITPNTIKLYLDKIPCGICCYKENGRILFSNICMNELCLKITENTLLSGNDFYEEVKNRMITVEGRVWRFSCRQFEMDGEQLYEMIASDITAEYAKTAALERDKAELSHLNKELGEYYQSIDESVKRQEILQAKINIHDEMNRLMLSTVAADNNETEALDNIFSLWEQNALLLCMEADKKSDAQQEDALNSLAQVLGTELKWQTIPFDLNDKQTELLYRTAQEALINAVKHARANNMEISFEQSEKALICRFTNNGKMPTGEVAFEGGLANLARLAKKQSAELYTELDDRFTLCLVWRVESEEWS